MVKIHIKKGDESHFLCDVPAVTPVVDLLAHITELYNGRLKVERICCEIEQLAEHGAILPGNMQGLTDEQIQELKLVDEWGETCCPSGGFVMNEDKCGRRNGKAPNDPMKDVLKKTLNEARELISKKLIEQNKCLEIKNVHEAIDILRGAIMIVYPMNLPPQDPIRLEFENKEDLTGTQASIEVISLEMATLWWAGKEILQGKKLADFVGKNDKTKIIAKLAKKGSGAPGREPLVTEKEQKEMMLYYHRKQEEWKKMQEEEAGDASYLNSGWADSSKLKKQFQGLTNVKWGPR